MTTTSVLLTVSSWSNSNDKYEKDCTARSTRNIGVIAARELRESPSTREQTLRIMREWIHQNHDVRNVREDDAFLLRFLRQKKYSIPMAQQTLLKYLSLRKYYPESFQNLDCDEPKMEEIINDGYIAVSPVRDAKGRRVIVYNINKFNAHKYNCWDMCKVHIMVYESLMDDPVDQVCGYTHVGDGSGVTVAHLTAWNPSDFGRIFKWGEQSIPMRHKECHLLNVAPAFRYIIDFAASKVPSKMAQRLKLHSSIKELQDSLDVASLPDTFGGKIPYQDMISYTKQILNDNKKKLLGLDEMEIISTKGIVSSRRNNEGNELQGSFRKLEID